MASEELLAVDLTYYQRPSLNLSTLHENLPQVLPVQAPLPALATTGTLKSLPIELMHDVLVRLDMRSLMNFRYVNKRAAELVESLPEYKIITKHAQNVLRRILCTQTGAWITCEKLCKKLFTYKCQRCGQFATYLYIITFKRTCFSCLSDGYHYYPISTNRAQGLAGWDDDRELQKLPCMKILPGTYSTGKCKSSGTAAVFYDFNTVSRTSVELFLRQRAAEPLGPYLDQLEPVPEPLLEPVPRLTEDDIQASQLRSVAIVAVPYLSKGPPMKEEFGFSCEACREAHRISRYPPTRLRGRRMFNTASFTAHLQLYGEIVNGKHQPMKRLNRGGMEWVPPIILPFNDVSNQQTRVPSAAAQ
jgi:hypothetical protein